MFEALPEDLPTVVPARLDGRLHDRIEGPAPYRDVPQAKLARDLGHGVASRQQLRGDCALLRRASGSLR